MNFLPPEQKKLAIQEFVNTWTTYSSATRAAKSIAMEYSIGTNTLIGWLVDADMWPRTRPSIAGKLEAENRQLRKENDLLRREIRNLYHELGESHENY